MATNYIEEGSVYILGVFDESISENIVSKMTKLINDKEKEKNPVINIYINSYGGAVKELYSLLTLIEMAKKKGIKIVTHNIGIAYSCGSILFVHGDVRKMYRYANHLMHLGTTVEIFETVEQVDRGTKRIRRHFDNIVNMYKDHTKMKKSEIETLLKDDKCYMSAEECLKKGICDEII